MDALESCDDDDVRRRLNRVQGCCATPEIRVSCDGEPALRMNVCRDRLCPRCQMFRGFDTAARTTALVVSFNAPRFVTLTLAHRDETLAAMLDRLQEAFRKLRKEPEWRTRIHSGVWVVQVTRNRQTNRWHAHLHMITDGAYFPQALLSRVWTRASGGSTICDIRAVPDRAKVASYIAGYVTRTDELKDWAPAEIVEYARAMHGRRTVHTFGKAHGVKIDREKQPEDAAGSAYVIHASIIVEKARTGDQRAAFVMHTLSCLGHDWACAFGIDPRTVRGAKAMLPASDARQAVVVAGEIHGDIWRASAEPPGHKGPGGPARDHAQGCLGRWSAS